MKPLTETACHSLENDQLRVEPATIEDVAVLTELGVSLLGGSGDFTPEPMLQERGLRLIHE